MVAFAHEFKSLRTPSGEKPQYPGFCDKVIVSDHLGSVREMTDSTGAVRARYDYDPFGRITKVSGDLEADFGFTGFYRHQTTGLNLTLYRAYDADLGRWLSRDPIAEQGGINLYGYVGNQPINATDSLGLILEFHGDTEAIGKAIEHLKKDPAAAELIDYLEHVPTVYKILAAFDADAAYHPDRRRIQWDPNFGRVDGFDKPGRSSATVLFHEFVHAYNHETDCVSYMKRRGTKDKQYDDAEERFVIEKFETPFTQRRNEGSRTSHSGIRYPVRSVSEIPILNSN